jgi:predicted CXXCH cytochrome family protein
MKTWIIILAGSMIIAFLYGCESATRYKVLSFIFDGVPAPGSETREVSVKASRKESVAVTSSKESKYKEHGPYAARMCEGCHLRATNALVLPIERLCFKCHTINVSRKYIHGPLASGGCKICHEPHGSSYPFLLVSEAKNFCVHCHDKAAIEKNEVHAGTEMQCTDCHDAHSSDYKYLLK